MKKNQYPLPKWPENKRWRKDCVSNVAKKDTSGRIALSWNRPRLVMLRDRTGQPEPGHECMRPRSMTRSLTLVRRSVLDEWQTEVPTYLLLKERTWMRGWMNSLFVVSFKDSSEHLIRRVWTWETNRIVILSSLPTDTMNSQTKESEGVQICSRRRTSWNRTKDLVSIKTRTLCQNRTKGRRPRNWRSRSSSLKECTLASLKEWTRRTAAAVTSDSIA